ncbi:MAG TPA: RNA methyltransferase [Candidatus Binataceae bacterium]|nr:RNA methyltransferase [Candidatus Binataceae bacterium]
MADLFLTLLHYPVLDRNGRIVTSAITSLDLHDLARSARTYDVRALYVVHPVAELREFALRLRDHWLTGPGRRHDDLRAQALALMRVVASLEEALADSAAMAGIVPLLVHTSARTAGGVSYGALRAELEQGSTPMMLLLGTGFGMAPLVAARADRLLAPILGPGDYNHLSVRAAGSIILDRLRGR